jgi:hypothetical protein
MRPNQPSCWSKCARPSSTERDQIFVATIISSRLPSSAAASDASAPPYIGDESTSRPPGSNAASTTRRASAASLSKVRHVPRPTTGPSRRSSIM